MSAAFLEHPMDPPKVGLGLAALGRPGYINLNRGSDLGEERSREALEAQVPERGDAPLDHTADRVAPLYYWRALHISPA